MCTQIFSTGQDLIDCIGDLCPLLDALFVRPQTTSASSSSTFSFWSGFVWGNSHNVYVATQSINGKHLQVHLNWFLFRFSWTNAWITEINLPWKLRNTCLLFTNFHNSSSTIGYWALSFTYVKHWGKIYVNQSYLLLKEWVLNPSLQCDACDAYSALCLPVKISNAGSAWKCPWNPYPHALHFSLYACMNA